MTTVNLEFVFIVVYGISIFAALQSLARIEKKLEYITSRMCLK